MEIRAIPLALDILVGLAAALTKEEETEQAIKLLQFPLHNPAASRETREKAQELMATLRPDTAIGLSKISERQLETVVAQLLATQAA